MFSRIIAAFDASPESGRALGVAIELSKKMSAALSVVTVVEPLAFYYSFAMLVKPASFWTAESEKQGLSLKDEARGLITGAGLSSDIEVVSGEEIGSIVECVNRHRSDLLVLGIGKHLITKNQTALKLVELLPCSMLGIR